MDPAWLGRIFFQIGSRNHPSVKEMKSNVDGDVHSTHTSYIDRKNMNFLSSRRMKYL